MSGGLIAVALIVLWLCSTPVVAAWLARNLEHASPVIDLTDAAALEVQAIVVLGGGRYRGAPEYGADTVRGETLERLRYAAHLHRLTDLPLAVVGGVVLKGSESESALMQRVLEDELSVPVEWTEDASRNTAENAFNARSVIPFDRIVLVTHAMHVRRATAAFETAGFHVVPAPMGFATGAVIDYGLFDWLPSMTALGTIGAALHEYIGLAWYRLRYGIK
jgi:uncharacterized SAM-binding protein YcdF (DUF218 family)